MQTRHRITKTVEQIVGKLERQKIIINKTKTKKILLTKLRDILRSPELEETM